MKDKLSLTKRQACRFILTHQNLLPPRELTGKDGILGFFDRTGCIQYDPLNIVGSNPEIVLQARVAGFKPEILEEMLYRDRMLIDGLDKMMAIYRITDWPYFRYRQIEEARHSKRRNADHTIAVIPEIRKEIEERGPLSSIDLEHDTKVAWAWGPTRLAKVALDDMYYQGELVVCKKINTRKVFDLACRYIPAEIIDTPDPHATMEEYHDWHFYRRLRSVGLVWNRPGVWGGIIKAGSKERTSALHRLVGKGMIKEVSIDEVSYPLYIAVHDMPVLEGILNSADLPVLSKAAVIAPLDNLLWDRELIRTLFGFSYTWEVYKPVSYREYGYYVLPVLYGDRFIARFEPGRDKQSGALIIKNWWWELGVNPDQAMSDALRKCFEDFLSYLGVTKIKIDWKLIKSEKLDWLP
jgi:uncharacterized protein